MAVRLRWLPHDSPDTLPILALLGAEQQSLLSVRIPPERPAQSFRMSLWTNLRLLPCLAHSTAARLWLPEWLGSPDQSSRQHPAE
jgi:hypothetical protein